MDEEIKMNCRGQIAIFIVLGLIFVVVAALVFVLMKKPLEVEVIDEENPQLFIQSCTKEFVEEAVEILRLQGGDIEPESDFMYNGKKVSYLCYNSNLYEPCINQRPLLIQYVEEEIYDYIEPKIESCFQTLKAKLEKEYEVNMDEMDLKVKLQSKQIGVEIDRKLEITRGDRVDDFEEFNVKMINPIHDLVEIAVEIVNQETEFCYFEYVGYSLLYPDYIIDKTENDDGIKVYDIKEKNSGKNFIFAVRSCVLPAGI